MIEKPTSPGIAVSSSRQSTRKTLARETAIEGTGIHSGAPCRVRLIPRGERGIRFQRPGRPEVEASWQNARADLSDRRTVIVGEDGERFDQIEHLMAGIAACGVTDVLVEQEGPEVPFLGGGALEFMEAILDAGVEETGRQAAPLVIEKPVAFSDEEAWLTAAPAEGLQMSCFVEFPGTVVGSMGFTAMIDREVFRKEIAPARTFALAADLEKLRAAGMIKGGNLNNAVVFDHERYYNDSLIFPDEVVRHKVIDLLGDLALAGRPLKGHFWAWRAGHRSHVKFVQFLMSEYGET